MFSWSPQLALTWELGGLAVILLVYLLATWAMVENRFFSGIVRIQKARDHTAITTGPFRLVRHPSYTGRIVSGLATPLLLGSLWALISAGLTAIGLVIRTALEDQTLIEELPGYDDSVQQTRFRLLLGIW